MTWRLPTPTGGPASKWVVLALGGIALLGATAPWVGVTPSRLAAGLRNIPSAVSQLSFEYDPADLPRVAASLWETLEIAFVATCLACALSLPLCVLAARNASPHPVVSWLMRVLLAGARGLPEMVWALMFVSALGLGAVPGVMAVAFVSVGFMAKFFAESLEVVPRQAVEGVLAHGADWLQVRLYGMFPQAMPDLIGTGLYMLDHNLRAAAILGVVGAGGIGYALIMSLRLCQYGRLVMICAGVYLVVTLIDRVSWWLRSRVI